MQWTAIDTQRFPTRVNHAVQQWTHRLYYLSNSLTSKTNQSFHSGAWNLSFLGSSTQLHIHKKLYFNIYVVSGDLKYSCDFWTHKLCNSTQKIHTSWLTTCNGNCRATVIHLRCFSLDSSIKFTHKNTHNEKWCTSQILISSIVLLHNSFLGRKLRNYS